MAAGGLVLGLLACGCSTPAQRGNLLDAGERQGARAPPVPASISAEHEELHGELAVLTRLGGKTGAAARVVAETLHPHFSKEEEFALPPLALLPALARGESPPADVARQAATLAAKLEAELPRMLDEHAAVVKALGELSAAAANEDHPDAARFAAKLVLHARNEEEVLYPAAILVGEILESRGLVRDH